MKILGVIPARYGSSRFPGKPLADICGKPMIWWVYQQAKNSRVDDLVVATDDERIVEACKNENIPVIMTSNTLETPNDRVYEVSKLIIADIYVCINGDEPLIDPEVINCVLPDYNEDIKMYYANAITAIKNPIEVMDVTNIKAVVNDNGEALWASRMPIPYPKGNVNFNYKKIIGVAAFSKDALDYYSNTPRSEVERLEELDLYRFLVNHKIVKLKEIECTTLSVDTPKDLLYVREVINKRMEK